MTTSENIEVKDVTYKAVVIHDKENGLYTVSLAETKGGPIISATSEPEAKDKFEKALALSCALQNLKTYKNAVLKADLDYVKKASKTTVEYVLREEAA